MSSFIITLIITIILVLLAVAGLAIGLILTGKPRIERGSCGRIPQRKRDDKCGREIKCPMCQGEEKKDDNSK